MTKTQEISIALAVFVVAAAVNYAWGTVIGNSKCYQGECTGVSQRCYPENSGCTWCYSGTNGKFCGINVTTQCNSNGESNCGGGTQYSGTCVWDFVSGKPICTGNNNPVPNGCSVPTCLDVNPPSP